ncbi:hypothetical protein GCM10009574_071570 [Streptomyces asiaticus]|uniref:Uncharacterized protein n=1 Tax=Streptomyces rhizosphaericus TaxID=114699 RepID=A0ABN1SEX2_9ACTN
MVSQVRHYGCPDCRRSGAEGGGATALAHRMLPVRMGADLYRPGALSRARVVVPDPIGRTPGPT